VWTHDQRASWYETTIFSWVGWGPTTFVFLSRLDPVQLRLAWSLNQPSDHEVNYLAIACKILQAMATTNGF
jgi:hypothetical protein